MEKAAPLLCEGLNSLHSNDEAQNEQHDKSLGVISLGGLGHMAVKFGKAFELEVTVIGRSESKREEAINLLGADNFILSKDHDQMAVSTHQ
jgi:cinnamyl-alcohol dehydrogenase